MGKLMAKTVSVRGLIKVAMGQVGTKHTLRAIYDAVARKIPSEEGVKSYGRVKGRSADDDTPLRDKVAQGRKRLVYRALSDMIYEGEAKADDARDWDKSYWLVKEVAAPAIAKRVAPVKKAVAKAKAKKKRRALAVAK